MPPFVNTFTKIAPKLEANGYQTVPIKPGSKAPSVHGWQTHKSPTHWIRVKKVGHQYTGILTEFTPAIDLDVRDEQLVDELTELANSLLGPTLTREGSPPKRILLYKTDQEILKAASPWFVLPTDDWKNPTYRAHRIEVLGKGQQVVAYGVHPGTGLPYRWLGHTSPLGTPAPTLPTITPTTATAYLQDAWDLVLRLGGLPVRQRKQQWCSVEKSQSEQQRRVKINAWWKGLALEYIAEPLKLKKSGRGWACRCPVHAGEHDNSLNIFTGDDGTLVAHCYAGCSFEDVSEAICDILDDDLKSVF